MDPLSCGIIGHLLGDILLQNDWMASNKKKDKQWLPCAIHCSIYTLATFICMLPSGVHWTLPAFVGILHYPIDRTDTISRYMELIGQREFKKAPFSPWSTILVDNSVHMIVLWALVVIYTTYS